VLVHFPIMIIEQIIPYISKKAVIKIRVAPIRPNVAKGLGTSRDI
jgi:hypothetical protein